MTDIHPLYGDLDEECPRGIFASGGKWFATKREAAAYEDQLRAEREAKNARPESFVYFARRGTSKSRVKIGFAKDPFKRLAMLQTGADERLNIIALLPGTPADERAIHREFADCRIIGEWFIVDAALRGRIKRIQAEHGQWLNPRFGTRPPMARILGRRKRA